MLIDSKMDKASVDQALAAVKAVTDKPIRYLVNTHGDGDHIRGNQNMPATITVIAHENCRKEFFLPGREGKALGVDQSRSGEFCPVCHLLNEVQKSGPSKMRSH